MMGDNIRLSPAEAKFIRSLSDFDLTMLLSEVDDHGWMLAADTLAIMAHAISRRTGDEPEATVAAAKDLMRWIRETGDLRARALDELDARRQRRAS